MFGPGEDVPAPTEGSVDSKALPRPQLVAYSRHQEHTPCPRCDHLAYRHHCGPRTLHDLGDWSTACPVDLRVIYSSHSCSPCRKHCNIDRSDGAPPGGHSTQRVIQMAVRLVVDDGLPSRPARWHRWRAHRVFVPCAPMPTWAEAGGKKGPRTDGGSVPRLGA